MATIFDYLFWRGDLTFESSPFNEVDGMILARYAYIPLEYAAQPLNPASVSVLSEALLAQPDLEDKVLMKNDVRLLEDLSKSQRFQNLQVSSYVNQTDAVSQTQFAAVVLHLAENLYFLSFRGTDNTLVGWKEDFNMSFVCPVPAQDSAVAYFSQIAALHEGNFILGGHSKGGNLAAYAAAFCDPSLQSRILAVYNYDGPGFDDKVLQEAGYQNVCGRIKTFVPQSSIVGMLLGHAEEYAIVHSAQPVGPLQHDIYSWEIQRNHFVHLETVTTSSRLLDATLKAMFAEMDIRQREEFVDAMYTVFLETNVHTLREMRENWFSSAKAVLKSLGNMDDSTREIVTQTLMSFARSAKQSMKNMV